MEQLSVTDIYYILDTAISFKEISSRPIKKVPTLKGKTIINFFFEPSTRTRLSFEIAAKRMSADTFNIATSTSSAQKGETLIDTACNLEAMSPDIIIIRHGSSGAPGLLTRHVGAAIINAGDGTHEHPSQALLDMMTVREHKKNIEGLKIAIVGDIAHSRVAHSNIIGFSKLGAEVRVAGPATFMPPHLDSLGAKLGLDILIKSRIRGDKVHSHVLGNALEALVGAIYLDRGYKHSKIFIIDVLIKNHVNIEELITTEENFKSRLIEYIQKEKLTLEFDTRDANNQRGKFVSTVIINDKEMGKGKGNSKKEAEQNAAQDTLSKM